MASSRTTGGRTGRPPVTSREQILAAARRLIDSDGWERLTVRGLAAELGIGTTTLYHHVRDREDLLVQLIGEQVSQIPRPDLPGEPGERIAAAATAMHDGLAALPWAVEVLTVDGFMGRLGDAAVWLVEVIVASAVEAGCSHEQAVVLFRNLWYYTVGEILVRARSAAGGGIDRQRLLAEEVARFDSRDAAATPTLAAIGDRWPEVAARDTFSSGVRAFVDGMLGSARAERGR